MKRGMIYFDGTGDWWGRIRSPALGTDAPVVPMQPVLEAIAITAAAEIVRQKLLYEWWEMVDMPTYGKSPLEEVSFTCDDYAMDCSTVDNFPNCRYHLP